MTTTSPPTLAQQIAVIEARAKIEREDPNGHYADVYEAVTASLKQLATLHSQIDGLMKRLLREEQDARRLQHLQAYLDRPPHESVFSVYEYGTKVFELRGAIDRRVAADSAAQGEHERAV